MKTVNDVIMSKDSERKIELLKIRADARAERNAKVREYAKMLVGGAIGVIGLYVTAIGLYVIH